MLLVVTSKRCPHCVTLKRALRAKQIPFQDIDIDTLDQDDKLLLADKDGMIALPTIIKGDRVIDWNEALNPPIVAAI